MSLEAEFRASTSRVVVVVVVVVVECCRQVSLQIHVNGRLPLNRLWSRPKRRKLFVENFNRSPENNKNEMN